MALAQQLDDTLKAAIKTQDARTANVVRMLKTKVTERTTAKGFAGQVEAADVKRVVEELLTPRA